MRSPPGTETIGRYTLFSEIASGGMATVHFGRLAGPAGFARIVAVKRLMPNLARDPEFVAMFLDEARVAARIRHPNVIPTLDIVAAEGELLLIMEYVQGESLSRLNRASLQAAVDTPLPVISAIVAGALHGLHAAHEAIGENGEPLQIVHRDVSPQNILVGEDGVVRVLDFGIASAVGRLQVTRDGQLKGKLAYMPPEQFWGKPLDRRADVYAMAVVLWECITQRRLFKADSDAALMTAVLQAPVDPPSEHRPGLPPGLDALVLRGLHREPEHRFASAREMAIALEDLIPPATGTQVARWVESLAGDVLKLRSQRIQDIESSAHARPAELPPDLAPLLSVAPSDLAPRLSAAPPPTPSSAPVEFPPPAVPEGDSPPGARRSPSQLLALGAAAFLLVVGGSWLLTRQPTDATTTAPSSSAVPAPSAPVATVAAPSTPPPTSAEALASSPPGPPSSPPRATSKPRPPAPPVDCSQPFYTDSKGIQRVKRQCLK